MFVNFFAGKVISKISPVPTLFSVSRSYMRAFIWVNFKGIKFAPVSTCSSAKAGKEKFAGKLRNWVGIELFQSPVADASGESWLNANLGTRGIKKARRIPALNDSDQSQVSPEGWDARLTLYTTQRRRRR